MYIIILLAFFNGFLFLKTSVTDFFPLAYADITE